MGIIDAQLEGQDIVLRIPKSRLQDFIDIWLDVTNSDSCFKITDVDAFAADVVQAMNAEESEDGTTIIDQLLDGAVSRAIEDGSPNVEECDD